MKKSLFILLCLVAGVLASCSKSMDDYYPDKPYEYTFPTGYQVGKTYTAIATLLKSTDGVVYLKVNEDLQIVTEKLDPLWEQVKAPTRVYCQFHLLEKQPPTPYYWAEIEWYEFVAMWDSTVVLDGGDAGLDIIDDWMTSLEDGFLTIHYSAWWGRGNIRHLVFIEYEKPNTFRLVNNDNGDEKLEKKDALYCLDINFISDHIDKENAITIKWKTCAGEQAEKQFIFKGRTD